MNKPVSVDLPHSLGAAEAKRRMASASDRLKDHIPGAADVSSRWEGDRMYLEVKAMGQEVTGHIDVNERTVHLELMVPPMLALFAGQIQNALQKKGGELLEDKSGRRDA